MKNAHIRMCVFLFGTTLSDKSSSPPLVFFRFSEAVLPFFHFVSKMVPFMQRRDFKAE